MLFRSLKQLLAKDPLLCPSLVFSQAFIPEVGEHLPGARLCQEPARSLLSWNWCFGEERDINEHGRVGA